MCYDLILVHIYDILCKTRRCTTVRISDDQAIPLRWARTLICILSTTAASTASTASAASLDQQHQLISIINNISIIKSISRIRYLPIYIKSGHISICPLTPSDMHPHTTRHHQTWWSRHHQIPPHMHHVWFVWSKTSHCGDKWRCHRCGTGQTTSKDRGALLLICESPSFAIIQGGTKKSN